MNQPDRRNVELKARLPSLDKARETACRLGTDQGVLHQVDSYYIATRGRLKLRVINGRRAELIWYFRPDTETAKTSQYSLVPVNDWTSLDEALTGALGVSCRVVKRRELFLHDNVRIHLDTVDDLGFFLEFEAVLQDGMSVEQGHSQLDFLQREFDLLPSQLIAVSYSDLLTSRA